MELVDNHEREVVELADGVVVDALVVITDVDAEHALEKEEANKSQLRESKKKPAFLAKGVEVIVVDVHSVVVVEAAAVELVLALEKVLTER